MGDAIGDYIFSQLTMQLLNDSGNMFSSIDLPSLPPSHTYFDTGHFGIGFTKQISPSTYYGAAVKVDNLRLSLVSPVPIPPALPLMATGLVVLGFIGRKKYSLN